MPKTQRAPSLTKTVDAASEKHGELLTLCWDKLDAVVRRLYSKSSDALALEVSQATDDFKTSCSRAAEAARRRADRVTSTDVKVALEQLANSIEEYANQPLASVPASLVTATIDERVLEQPISETRRTINSSRKVTVGFIDIACRISVPGDLALQDDLPHFLDTNDPDNHLLPRHWKGQESLDTIDLATVKRVSMKTPTWLCNPMSIELWGDVRTSEQPVGIFLRELKTLREHGPVEWVVMDDFDDRTKELLVHEGFVPLSRAYLESFD